VATRPKTPSKSKQPGTAIVPRRGQRLGGRALGTRNKVSKQAKANLEEAFTRLGDVNGLVTWGRKNRTEFYKIWARLIPKDVSVNPGEGLEDLLLKLAERDNTPIVDTDYIVVSEEAETNA